MTRFPVATCAVIFLLFNIGCGGEVPTPSATDNSETPQDSADSSIGTTDSTTPPETVSIPENLPEAERAAATVILELGGHLDQESSGHVQAIDLSGTKVKNADLEVLQALTNLQGLILTDTEISDDGLQHIAKLSSLITLELYRTPVTDAGLKHLSNLSNLAGLYLKGTMITNDGLAHIAGLQNLTLLSLSNTELTDNGLVHLRGLTKLESLIVEDTQVTGKGLIENLSGLKNLESIRADGTKLSGADVATVQKALPGVRVIGPQRDISVP